VIDLAAGSAAGGQAPTEETLDAPLESILAMVKRKGRLPDFVVVTYGAKRGGEALVRKVEATLGRTGLVVIGGTHAGCIAAGLVKGVKEDLVPVRSPDVVAVCAVWMTGFAVSKCAAVCGFALTSTNLRVDSVAQNGRVVRTFSGLPARDAIAKHLPRGTTVDDLSLNPLARVTGHDDDGEPILCLISMKALADGTVELSEPAVVGEDLHIVAATADDVLLRTDKALAQVFESSLSNIQDAYPDTRIGAGNLSSLCLLPGSMFGPAGLKKTLEHVTNKDLKKRYADSFPSKAVVSELGEFGSVSVAGVVGVIGNHLRATASMVSVLVISPDITPFFTRTDAELAAEVDPALLQSLKGAKDGGGLSMSGGPSPAVRTTSMSNHSPPGSVMSRTSHASSMGRSDLQFFSREHYVPPGMCSLRPSLAYVVTDVEASTEMWQLVSSAGQCMMTHDKCLRRLMMLHRGYEARSLGDSFHIVFSSAYDAAAFCLSAVMSLWLETWPSDCRAFAAARSQGRYKGLGVRLGFDVGNEYETATDVDTHGVLYSGRLVKNSKVISDKGHGGQIVLTARAVEALKPLMKCLPGQNAQVMKTREKDAFYLVNDSIAPLNPLYDEMGLRAV
jgi:hypothetical protein